MSIIRLTAVATVSDREYLAAGMEDNASKNFKPDLLFAAIPQCDDTPVVRISPS